MAADRPIHLPHQGTEGSLWNALLDVADAQPGGWTLIGALMVMLHAHAAGIDARRATRDADALADTRGVTQATRLLAATLEQLGWEMHPDHPRANEVGFRFIKDGLLFDVLAPDGLGERADITTVPPLTTVAIPGGSRALRRSVVRDVVVGEREGRLPVPDLLGALVIKARAATSDRGPASDPTHRPERHPEDMAVLYACATDLRGLAADTTNNDRKALRTRASLARPRPRPSTSGPGCLPIPRPGAIAVTTGGLLSTPLRK